MNRVTRDIAVKLKDKGYNRPCTAYYSDLNLYDGELTDHNNTTIGDTEMHKRNAGHYSAPTITEVIQWFLDEHGFWVYTYPVAPWVQEGDDYPKVVWVGLISSLKQLNFEKFVDADNGLAVNHHHKPEDALMVAIDYLIS